MRTEYVQAIAVDAETGRPVHAVLALIADDEGAYDVERLTLCRRLPIGLFRPFELPLAPFLNAPVPDRCATCQALHLQLKAGLPAEVATFDAAAMHRPLDMLQPTPEETAPEDLISLPE